MSEAFRIGIIGLGTVGTGVVKILQEHADLMTQRAGRKIEIKAVCAQNKDKDRGVNLSSYEWVDHPEDMAARDDVDCVIELIGGAEGDAYDAVFAALNNQKHVVTANKALVAHHGYALAQAAENNGVSMNYEAAVAGGIPIIKTMREGLAANEISEVYGILNGTCNYILSQMRETGRDFDDVLKDAQEFGYAEADPTFDIEGIDAAHKLCILTAIAFGVRPDFEKMSVEGVTQITATDIKTVTEFGYRIKLLGIARKVDGEIIQEMAPCLVPIGSAIGIVEDVFNAVYTIGDFVDTTLMTGRGAGEGPTASSVVADIIDLARGVKLPTFGVPYQDLKQATWLDKNQVMKRYYLRLNVLDKPGVIAKISEILGKQDISIEQLIQHGQKEQQSVPVIITTHQAKYLNIAQAVDQIEKLETTIEKPCLIAIEEL